MRTKEINKYLHSFVLGDCLLSSRSQAIPHRLSRSGSQDLLDMIQNIFNGIYMERCYSCTRQQEE